MGCEFYLLLHAHTVNLFHLTVMYLFVFRPVMQRYSRLTIHCAQYDLRRQDDSQSIRGPGNPVSIQPLPLSRLSLTLERKSAHLTQNQFNWLGSIFYLSYLVFQACISLCTLLVLPNLPLDFQYPQNLALQRFPVGKWMSINIFIWAIALLSHAACKSFGGLFAVRFILGICEGAITPGFMIVSVAS
jgi:MFS family permease